MNTIKIYQYADRHEFGGRLYFPEQVVPFLGAGSNSDATVRQAIEMMHNAEDFRTWCWERKIPIHGEKHGKVPQNSEYIELTDDQRFEFKMRWGF